MLSPMRLRLTDKLARDLPAPARGRLVIFDEQQPGLMFRITPNDARTFAVWFRRRSGAKETVTLGKLGDLSLSEARALTRQTRFEVMAGVPLSAAKRKSTVAAQPHKGLSVTEAIERYRSAHIERQALKSAPDVIRRLNKEIVAVWGKRQLADIQRSDVHALLDSIVDRGAPKSANATLALLRGFMNWALSRDLIDSSPCLGIRRPVRAESRTRVLDERELCGVWRATAQAAETQDCFRVMVRLLILTAARRTEIAGLAWKELDFSNQLWRLPRERSKNSREHVLPLSLEAQRTLLHWRKSQNSAQLLFPSVRTAERHFTGYGKSLARLRAESNTSGWGLHDLRRTCATWLEEHGTAPHVVGKILNHTLPGIGSVYMRADHQLAMRQALEKWAGYVSALD
ncbi:MAG: tyrosine-type recombinase/integrase [Betaproteobacteria bacterium]